MMGKNKFSLADVKVDESKNQLIHDAILDGLRSFSAPWLGLGKLEHFTLYVTDTSKNNIAGVCGATRQYALVKTAWLHKVWVESTYQLQGLGTHLINCLENFAYQRNCSAVQLEAFDFQGIDFFKKQGYQIQATLTKALADRDQYFLYKNSIVKPISSTNFSDIIIDETDSHDIKKIIFNGVKNYSNPYFGYEDFKDFSLHIASREGVIVGGITGIFSPKYTQIHVMWIDSSYRGHGLGRMLWQKLEDYLRVKKCSIVLVGTLEFHAKAFYEKLGCRHQGTIRKWIGGYDQHWFEKIIN
jgi:GNAT superfamily N-acetyltransferase